MRVFIYGSCVSRDLIPYLAPAGYELVAYVARQSLLSAMHGPVPVAVPETRFSSKFQLRSISSDFAGDLRSRLDEHAGGFDLLLWDLTDERNGVHRVGDAYATDNWELHATRAIEDLEFEERIAFGSDEHFELWCEAADAFLRELEDRGALERLVVLAPDFAERRTDGTPFAAHPRPAEEYREAYGRYFDHLAIRRGVRFVSATAEEVATSDDHQWGPAPFHYDRATCRLLAERLARTAAPLVCTDAELEARTRVAHGIAEGPTSVDGDGWSEWRFGEGAERIRLRLRSPRRRAAGELTVLLTGAVDPNAEEEARLFQRLDWAESFEGPVAYLADPTLIAHPDLRAAWGVGAADRWAVPLMAAAIDELASRLGRGRGRGAPVRIVGTGAGGFLALAIASLCRSEARAVVAGPMLSWHDYVMRSLVDRAIEAAAGDAGPWEAPSERTDLGALWRRTAHVPPFTAAFNACAPAEATAVLTRWTELARALHRAPSFGRQTVTWYRGTPGVGQPPSRDELFELLDADAAAAAAARARASARVASPAR